LKLNEVLQQLISKTENFQEKLVEKAQKFNKANYEIEKYQSYVEGVKKTLGTLEKQKVLVKKMLAQLGYDKPHMASGTSNEWETTWTTDPQNSEIIHTGFKLKVDLTPYQFASAPVIVASIASTAEGVGKFLLKGMIPIRDVTSKHFSVYVPSTSYNKFYSIDYIKKYFTLNWIALDGLDEDNNLHGRFNTFSPYGNNQLSGTIFGDVYLPHNKSTTIVGTLLGYTEKEITNVITPRSEDKFKVDFVIHQPGGDTIDMLKNAYQQSWKVHYLSVYNKKRQGVHPFVSGVVPYYRWMRPNEDVLFSAGRKRLFSYNEDGEDTMDTAEEFDAETEEVHTLEFGAAVQEAPAEILEGTAVQDAPAEILETAADLIPKPEHQPTGESLAPKETQKAAPVQQPSVPTQSSEPKPVKPSSSSLQIPTGTGKPIVININTSQNVKRDGKVCYKDGRPWPCCRSKDGYVPCPDPKCYYTDSEKRRIQVECCTETKPDGKVVHVPCPNKCFKTDASGNRVETQCCRYQNPDGTYAHKACPDPVTQTTQNINLQQNVQAPKVCYKSIDGKLEEAECCKFTVNGKTEYRPCGPRCYRNEFGQQIETKCCPFQREGKVYYKACPRRCKKMIDGKELEVPCCRYLVDGKFEWKACERICYREYRGKNYPTRCCKKIGADGKEEYAACEPKCARMENGKKVDVPCCAYFVNGSVHYRACPEYCTKIVNGQVIRTKCCSNFNPQTQQFEKGPCEAEPKCHTVIEGQVKEVPCCNQTLADGKVHYFPCPAIPRCFREINGIKTPVPCCSERGIDGNIKYVPCPVQPQCYRFVDGKVVKAECCTQKDAQGVETLVPCPMKPECFRSENGQLIKVECCSEIKDGQVRYFPCPQKVDAIVEPKIETKTETKVETKTTQCLYVSDGKISEIPCENPKCSIVVNGQTVNVQCCNSTAYGKTIFHPCPSAATKCYEYDAFGNQVETRCCEKIEMGQKVLYPCPKEEQVPRCFNIDIYGKKTEVQCCKVSHSQNNLVTYEPCPDEELDEFIIRVDTRRFKFVTTPVYIASIYGSSGHETIIGQSTIFNPSKDGFYVRVSGVRKDLTRIEKRNLKLHWLATNTKYSAEG
jgi:hypothetical protein